jgi:hypothetical protein
MKPRFCYASVIRDRQARAERQRLIVHVLCVVAAVVVCCVAVVTLAEADRLADQSFARYRASVAAEGR